MNVRSNLLREIKQHYQRELLPLYGEHEAVSMLNMLIQHFFNLSRVDQSLQPGFRLTETEMLKLHFAVKELKKEKPIQYIMGTTEFAGLTIKVTRDVLIPRPETEELVEKIVSATPGYDELQMLDVGTGSGCIALALKSKLPKCHLTAVDVIAEAIGVAHENMKLNHLDVSFLQMDILDKASWKKLDKYDVIVSNPPYVTMADKKQMQNNVVNHEPHLALFVTDEDPLIFYHAITDLALSHLNSGGHLWFEINEALGNEVSEFLENKGFREVVLHNDLNNKPRFVAAVKPK